MLCDNSVIYVIIYIHKDAYICVQYENFGQNLDATVMRSLEIANFVDSVSLVFLTRYIHNLNSSMHKTHLLQVYQELNIHVVLVSVITWTNGDQISVNAEALTLLENFRDYQSHITAEYDSAMLIT